jgi:hypothetical protein
MDDFTILSEEDKSHISYGACVAGMTLTGMAVGRFVGLQGVLAGGVAGAAFGLLTCKHLQEPIKRKLFSPTATLSDHELSSALRAIRTQRPLVRKHEAMDMFARIREEIAGNPEKYARTVRA